MSMIYSFSIFFALQMSFIEPVILKKTMSQCEEGTTDHCYSMLFPYQSHPKGYNFLKHAFYCVMKP